MGRIFWVTQILTHVWERTSLVYYIYIFSFENLQMITISNILDDFYLFLRIHTTSWLFMVIAPKCHYFCQGFLQLKSTNCWLNLDLRLNYAHIKRYNKSECCRYFGFYTHTRFTFTFTFTNVCFTLSLHIYCYFPFLIVYFYFIGFTMLLYFCLGV